MRFSANQVAEAKREIDRHLLHGEWNAAKQAALLEIRAQFERDGERARLTRRQLAQYLRGSDSVH